MIEETAPADTPILVLGKPEMRDIGIVMSATLGGESLPDEVLAEVFTCSGQNVQAIADPGWRHRR